MGAAPLLGVPRLACILALLMGAGCAYNPPLERGRRGEPSMQRRWDDAGDPAMYDAGVPNQPPPMSDAGPGAVPDAGAPDAGPAPDAGAAPVDCGQFTAIGYEVCASFADACEIIFRDRSGCASACARAGLVCEDSWNDESGLCAPNRGQHYGCSESGHDSDYCVCVRAR